MKMVRGAVAGAVIVVAAAVGGGCAVNVEGDFSGISFSPTQTAVAVLDTHEILVRRGALVPVERPRALIQTTIWLSSATVPTTDVWRHLPAERIADIKKDLALSDLLLLQNINFDTLQDGDVLTAQTGPVDAEEGRARGGGDFAFFLGQRPTPDDGGGLLSNNGLGGKVTVEIEASRLERDGSVGELQADVRITRERAATQPASGIAVGTVTLSLSLPLSPERLAEANLAMVAPVARCAAERGPDGAGACAAVVDDDVIDATGVH
jgi:hypothetical protein